MNLDTPIVEVVTFLAPEDADMLLAQDHELRVLILNGMRAFLCLMEETERTMDPITTMTALHDYLQMFLNTFYREESS